MVGDGESASTVTPVLLGERGVAIIGDGTDEVVYRLRYVGVRSNGLDVECTGDESTEFWSLANVVSLVGV